MGEWPDGAVDAVARAIEESLGVGRRQWAEAAARAAIAALLPWIGEREGFVLVPREPDRKMIKRGRAEIGGGSTFRQEERDEMAAEIYRAMIAAAPRPDPPAVQGER